MEDEKIVELFWERSQQALKELSEKYGKLCFSIAFRILGSEEDAQECENDMYLKLWNAIPPNRPQSLSAFACKTVRNLALDRFKYDNRKKRSCEIDVLYSELIDCIPSGDDVTEMADDTVAKAISTFLEQLDVQTRVLFVRRYFYMERVNSLGTRYGMTPSHVSTKLNRVRKKLKQYLEQEGIVL